MILHLINLSMCVMSINNSPSARESWSNHLKYQLYFCRTWSILQVLQIKPATNFIYKRINKYMCTWSSAKFISKRLKLFVCDRQNGYCHQQGVETNGVKSHNTTTVISIKVKVHCHYTYTIHTITQDLKLDFILKI